MTIATYRIFAYILYMAVSIGLTVYLARTLKKNGAVFLIDVFDKNPDLAQAVNQLLVTGFYMLSLGWACLILHRHSGEEVDDLAFQLIDRFGRLFLSLGVFHMFNLYLFHRIRRRGKPAELPLPVLPQLKLEHP